MPGNNLNNADLITSNQNPNHEFGLKRWVKVGVIAAASALAGGMAAAWFYRKTLNTLRNAELDDQIPESAIPDTGTDSED